MAQALQFTLAGTAFEAVPVKLERKKLYGYTEIVARDASGAVCAAAQVDPDGELLVPTGAVKPGILDEDGRWVERAELVAVDAEGKELTLAPSSFGQVIELANKATEEDFLDHIWKSVYQLDTPELAAAVGADIYAFPFNYRAAPAPDDGFLLAEGGAAFLFAGEKIEFEYLGIAEEGVLDEDESESADEDEDLDFGMM